MSDFAAQVKQQADIVRIIGDYVSLKKSGAQNFTGLCPFHKEKSPSFSVHATRQFFHCFGCGVSGDVFSFVQKVENITFPEAVRAVAQKLGIAPPKMQYSGPEEAREAQQRGRLLDLHERACQWFQEQLQRPDGARAREYLAGRGLTPEIISTFRIGFAPESGFLLRDALRGSFDDATLKESGLFSWKEVNGKPATNEQRPTLYSKFRNRVMFPICNEAGKVIAFTGRTLGTGDKAGPKYLNSPETPIYSKGRVLFNLDKARPAIRNLDYSIVVEGQMDCISVYAAGFHNVIASSGTAFTETQARLLGRFSKKIVVNFDPDTAGAAAAERSLGMLVEEDFTIKVLTLEAGFDPDLFIRRKGAQAYGEALRNAAKYFDYLIGRALAQSPARNPEGKLKAVNFLLPHLQRVPSRIVRDELATEIAQKVGIDSQVLRQELRHAAAARTSTIKAADPGPRRMLSFAEEKLIRALYMDGCDLEVRRTAQLALRATPLISFLPSRDLIDKLTNAEDSELDEIILTEDERAQLATALMPPRILFPEHERDSYRNRISPEDIGALVHELALRGELAGRRAELQAQIREAERRHDSDTVLRLLREQQDLDKKLRDVAALTA